MQIAQSAAALGLHGLVLVGVRNGRERTIMTSAKSGSRKHALFLRPITDRKAHTSMKTGLADRKLIALTTTGPKLFVSSSNISVWVVRVGDLVSAVPPATVREIDCAQSYRMRPATAIIPDELLAENFLHVAPCKADHFKK